MVEAFEEWAGTRGPALIRFGYLLAGDHHLAEDLAQEALARVHSRWGRLATEHPDAYARKVMVNQLTSWRRRRSWSERAAEDVGADLVTASYDGESADREALWSLLQQLPGRQRAVVILRFYEDHDDETIARILGCAPTTVRVHMRRALSKLREHLMTTDVLRSTP